LSEEVELQAAAGFIAPELRAEFPGLALDWVTAAASTRDSPPAVKRRLRDLSNRYRGASVVAMRTQPIPSAYRTFFRQIGLDPDTTRIPSEDAAVQRLLAGGFLPMSLIADALLIALLETGVPVWALDADHVDPGGLGIRPTIAGDRLGSGEDALTLAPGRLAVADARAVHGLLFGDLASAHVVGPRTERASLFTVSVDGVPRIHVEEALWVCVEVLAAGSGVKPR
jgi:DNA/RNA-binding domain of Phe-tRNA-synthetase-like protein